MNTIVKLSTTHNWNLPTVCPVCGEPLELSSNHRQLTCTNDYCPSRSAGNIAKWCDKLKIKEMGLTTIEKIQELGYMKTVSAMYQEYRDASINDILVELLGKVWTNIKKEIDSHSSATVAQFISGYNISGVGEKQVQKIIDSTGYGLDDFLDPSRVYSDYMCDGIGEVIAMKLHEGINKLRDDMKLTAAYIAIIGNKVVVPGVGLKLSGMSFCFTGAMEYKRSVLQDMVEKNGGINFDTVKKGLTYLVMADPNSTSSKAVKARSLGINLITPEQFLEMIG